MDVVTENVQQLFYLSQSKDGDSIMSSVKPIRPTVVKDRKIIKAIIKEVSTPPTEEAVKKNIELSELLKKVRT